MVSLLDIGDLKEEVDIRGKKIDVTGVSASGAVTLLTRFPEIRKLFAGKAADVTVEAIVSMAPELVAAIIAAGCGSPGDVKHEEAARKLGIEEQFDLITAILRLTFPAGVGPFVERLYALMPDADVAAVASGWEAGTKSPEGSNNSSN